MKHVREKNGAALVGEGIREFSSSLGEWKAQASSALLDSILTNANRKLTKMIEKVMAKYASPESESHADTKHEFRQGRLLHDGERILIVNGLKKQLASFEEHGIDGEYPRAAQKIGELIAYYSDFRNEISAPSIDRRVISDEVRFKRVESLRAGLRALDPTSFHESSFTEKIDRLICASDVVVKNTLLAKKAHLLDDSEIGTLKNFRAFVDILVKINEHSNKIPTREKLLAWLAGTAIFAFMVSHAGAAKGPIEAAFKGTSNAIKGTLNRGHGKVRHSGPKTKHDIATEFFSSTEEISSTNPSVTYLADLRTKFQEIDFDQSTFERNIKGRRIIIDCGHGEYNLISDKKDGVIPAPRYGDPGTCGLYDPATGKLIPSSTGNAGDTQTLLNWDGKSQVFIKEADVAYLLGLQLKKYLLETYRSHDNL